MDCASVLCVDEFVHVLAGDYRDLVKEIFSKVVWNPGGWRMMDSGRLLPITKLGFTHTKPSWGLGFEPKKPRKPQNPGIHGVLRFQTQVFCVHGYSTIVDVCWRVS